MKLILSFFIFLFYIHLPYAGTKKNCNKVFTDYKMWQFTETIIRYFSANKNIPDGYKWNGKKQTPIQPTIDKLVSAGKSRKEILRYLVTMGYLKVENTTTLNPLFDYILSRPSSEIIQLIKENPSFLHEGTLMGLPPFFLIVFMGNKQVMEAAIAINKTQVNSRNALDETPLHYTIDPEIATKLLYYNARPDAQDKKGYVALHNMRNPETIETVLYYKADSNVRDRSGMSLIRYHEKFVGDLDIMALLNQAREKQRTVKDSHVNDFFLEESREEYRDGIETATSEALSLSLGEKKEQLENVNQTDIGNEPKQAIQTIENNSEGTREAKKAQKVKEAIKLRQQRVADQRDQLIAHIADGITAILIRRMLANKKTAIRYFIPHIGIYIDRASLTQKKYLSGIVILNKELEQEFEMKLVQAYRKIENKQYSEQREKEYLNEITNIARELTERLKVELQDTSLKAIKRIMSKAERTLFKVEKIAKKWNQHRNNQLPPFLAF